MQHGFNYLSLKLGTAAVICYSRYLSSLIQCRYNVLAFPGNPPAEEQTKWQKDLTKAEAEAARTGEPLDRQAEEIKEKQSIWNTFQLSYAACYQALRRVYKALGLMATKKTHAPRGSGAREAQAGGYVPCCACAV